LLTKYRGGNITYDEIGNPLSYYDGRRFYFEWEGRQLKQLTLSSVVTTFEYNSEGLRTNKTTGGVSHDYIWSGDRLLAEVTDDYILKFFYDASGNVLGFEYLTPATDASGNTDYTGTTYYYEKNIFGDVVAIYDENGTKVGAYGFNSFGQNNVVTNLTDDNIASLNPIRYRSYYYDTDIYLYYLQSRYYDPVTCRFINADGQLNGGLLGNNLFAYCENNPVMYADPDGTMPKWLAATLGIAAGVALAAAIICAVPAAACAVGFGVGLLLGTSSAIVPATVIATFAGIAVAGAAGVYTADSVYAAGTGESVLLNEVFNGNVEAYEAVGLGISMLTAGISYMSDVGNAHGICFVAGTLISTECGNVPIEKITAGTLVYAHNPDTNETALKEVVRTFVNETTELMHITVNGEEIVCTNEHPFYSPVKGWIAACKLRAGDILVTVNGQYVVVEQVQHEILESPITVYNFEVADFHTYYVGKSAVLVHNTCGGNSSSKGVGGKGWVGDKTWRENVSTVGKGGTITSLNGGVPSKAQAVQLINQSGGTVLRIEGAHQFPNPHNYLHINYITSTGVKGTIKIFE